MKIIQFLPTLAFGDAVGNGTIALGRAIKEMATNGELYKQYKALGGK